ncbi:hypothetical protein [Streptomyces sp. B6B3]|uniref:hypothetical protein n=1 Tax=Streptomyces sp. B6B3 TaxID=3153570 RepID=UPI00325F0EFB
MNDRDPGFRREPEGPEDGYPYPPDPLDPDFLAQADWNEQDDGEEILRRLLRDTVRPIEPSPDSLEHLRVAVPARRRRHRQLLLGAAASVVLLGVGMPLMVTSAARLSGGEGEAVGADEHGYLGENGTVVEGNSPDEPDMYDTGGGETPYPEQSADGGTGDESSTPGGGDQSGDGDVMDSWESLGATSPTCTRSQLGDAETVTHEPDAEGRIYGAIRMANISDEACRIDGTGELVALPLGETDSADVQIIDRTEGDRAEGLPTPDESYQELILAPGTGYEVQFAYVPEAEAGSGGCTVSDPSTDPTEPVVGTDEPAALSDAGDTGGTAEGSEGDNSGTGGDTGDNGENGNGGDSEGESGDNGDNGDGGTTDGGTGETDDGVVLRYTPSAGEPEAAQVPLAGVCTGTVYRTGVLEAETS